jgi:hypothetical protein
MAGTLPIHFHDFPNIFPKFSQFSSMKNGGRFPSHPWLAGNLSPGAELLASFTGPELAALIEVRSEKRAVVTIRGQSQGPTWYRWLYQPIGPILSYYIWLYIHIIHIKSTFLFWLYHVISPCEPWKNMQWLGRNAASLALLRTSVVNWNDRQDIQRF